MTREEILAIKGRLEEYRKVGKWAPLVRDAQKDIETLLEAVEMLQKRKLVKSNSKKQV